MKKNILLEEAQDFLMQNCPDMSLEHVSLADALGRVLFKDIIAGECIPPFDRSPYDGYAFQAEDTQNAAMNNPILLKVIEEIPAGHVPDKKVASGKAAKILTGAPIPEGANAVINFEKTKLINNFVSIFHPVKIGENVISKGEDVALGDIVAEKGTLISPPVMGLMASLGLIRVPVYQRPKVAVISTGDEILEAGEPLSPGRIRNSNTYTLIGYIKSLGAEPVPVGTARDKREEIASLINKGLAEADMVITTGGISAGDFDVVKESIDLLGGETLFWKIDIKPGSPTLAALKDGKVILGLSGNPAAAMISFQLLGFPYIKKLAGRADFLNKRIHAALKTGFEKSGSIRRFLRGKLVYEDGIAFIDNSVGQDNGVLSSLKDSNILAEIPPGSGPLKSGEKLMGYLINY